MKSKRGRSPSKKQPEQIECAPVPMSELEEAAKEVLFPKKSEGQHSENREPTVEELKQPYKLKRR